jgi:hypothetical protein
MNDDGYSLLARGFILLIFALSIVWLWVEYGS